MPNDPDAQLSIAIKIMNHAYAQRVSLRAGHAGLRFAQASSMTPAHMLQVAELEAESVALQESLNQRHHTIKGLERKLATFEVEVQELQQKVGLGL